MSSQEADKSGASVNGASRQLEDVTGDNYATGDKLQLLKEGSPDSQGTSEVAPLQLGSTDGEKPTKCGKHVEGLKVIVASSITFAVAITVALIISIYYGPPQVQPHAAIACDVPRCSEIGKEMLQKGGHAVDAAIASMLCLGVMNGHASGLGGGGVMLVHDHKTLKTTGFDFMATAPNKSTENMFVGKPNAAKQGGLSVAVPGEVRAMEAAHNKFGRLQWKDLFAPTIKIATQGYRVSRYLATELKKHVDMSTLSSELAKIYVKNGKLVEENDVIKRPDLAKTLTKIADQGAKAFYEGELADSIVEAVSNKSNGILTNADLAGYKVKVVEPIHTTFRSSATHTEFTLLTPPPPSGGAVVLSMLNIMEGYNLTAQSRNHSVNFHRLVEAMKFGFAGLGNLADPAFNPGMLNVTQHMISKKLGKDQQSLIQDDRAFNKSSHYGMNYMFVEDHGPGSQVSVIGLNEDLVTITSSLNGWMGSKVLTSSGILLNNHMACFSTPGTKTPGTKGPNPENFIKPGKRPQMPLSPIVIHSAVKRCGLRMAIGASGGLKILTAITQYLLNYLSFGMPLDTSVTSPRLHEQLVPSVVQYEPNYRPKVLAFLRRVGDAIQRSTSHPGLLQVVSKINTTTDGFSDPRDNGTAVVY